MVGVAATLLLLLTFGIYLVGASGLGRETLREAAERALERAVGREVATTIGGARVSFDGSHLIGLEIAEVGIRTDGQSRPFAQAASLRFGIELMPLLSGRLALSGGSLSDASIDLTALGQGGESDWLRALRRPDGLVDPGRLPPFVFTLLQRAFVALERDFSGSVALADVSVLLPAGTTTHELTVTAAEAAASDPAALTVSAEGTLDGRSWNLSGVSERDPASGRIALIDLDAAVARSETAAPPDGASAFALGTLRVQVKGGQGAGGEASRLFVNARTEGSTFDLKNNRGALSGRGEVAVVLAEGVEAVRIERLGLGDDRSRLDLAGSVRPEAGSQAGPAYAFDLGGSDLFLAAADVPEQPFRFGAKLSGRFEPASHILRAESVELRSGEGTVSGSLGLQPVEGKSSGIDVALAFSALPVAGLKQLWPWFAARGARGWVQNHVAGGTVEEGRIDYHVPPGWIGSGVPPTADQLSGRLTVTGAQFDTAGEMPPVRGADGIVSFKGTDADIAVSGAAMTLPSGRELATNGGSLTLRGVHKAPLVGRLEVSLQGDAAAAAELAGLKPIDALKKLPFKAGDLGGPIEARVAADIPFTRDFPRDRLDFAVSARFAKLSVAVPLEGQTLRDADGTLAVDPQKAVFQASATLNGMPAQLSFTEPLRPDGPARSRKVELSLDDKARAAIAPGLSALVSGPMVLEVDAGASPRRVRADLTKARLSAPWVGWSKGAGVPAEARFGLAQAGGRTTVTDLDLAGDTFRITGSAELDKGGIVSARLPDVRLNRGDQLSVSIRRAGKGLDVTVRGTSYDARAVVKLATDGQGKPGESTGRASAETGSVSLDAELETVRGFGDESLKGVRLAYRSGAGQSRSLTIRGATDTGGALSISDATAGGQRQVALQTADAGSMLRFLNIYGNMRGGGIDVTLAGGSGGPLEGRLDARNFALINEARLGSLVSARGSGSARSLKDAVRKDIDTSRVQFDRASANITKGERSLTISKGVLRGNTIGSTFQGTLFDERGRMDMTGTFMPAYGLNRLFGELPLIGLILGNGSDRGLIGVTFKLEGDAKSPRVTVNPLSIIAPGIFRQIFEFN